MERKPLAPMFPPLDSRDERVSIRMTAAERAMFELAARAEGIELSRYIRGAAMLGHNVKQAQQVLKVTGA